MTNSVLILGGTGRFGRNAAEAFWNRGWRVTLFDRKTQDLKTAAQGHDVIVNAWNPPYNRWETVVPGLTRDVIDAARSAGATIIVPGNVYVFGSGSPEHLGPDTPHRATNPLGQVRRDLEEAYRNSGVQVILLRAGDFLDTEASGNWFDKVITAGIGKGRFSYPGNPDIPHAWAWLPDLTRAAAELAEKRAELDTFTEVSFPGYALSGHELAAACSRVLGRELTLSRMNWFPIQIAVPFWPLARHFLEMRYLWNMPHRLDGTRLRELLPDHEDTSLDDALKRALGFEDRPEQPVTPRPTGETGSVHA